MGRNHQRYDKSGHQICYLPISFLSYSNQFLWSEMPSVLDSNCWSPSLALPGFIKSIWWLLQLRHASPFSAGLPLPTSSLTMTVSVSCHQQKIHPIILSPILFPEDWRPNDDNFPLISYVWNLAFCLNTIIKWHFYKLRPIYTG